MSMKQINMFPQEGSTEDKSRYTSKVESPIYEPKQRQPHAFECFNKSKAIELLSKIERSAVSEDEKKMLREAASRHIVFNYEKMADYYAHASPKMQSLMEDSALVIIDFEKAIDDGFVRLCQDLKDQYREEYPDAE